MAIYSSFEIGKRFKIICSFLCIVFIQSCSESQVGKRLAESFEMPLNLETSKNSNKNERKALSSSQEKTKSIGSKVEIDANSSKSKTSPLKSKKELSSAKNDKSRKSSVQKKVLYSSSNSPYRIIIRILQTNPSAPAETVTSLLRDAGVKFEVEKIERIEKNTLRKNFSLGK